MAEAKETLACSMLSVPLLLGLAANAAFGWWWADPVAALCMVPWLVKEGRQALRGEPCCGATPEPNGRAATATQSDCS
jgi:divalent metal cation (Fe/Co/Zn/Cd) transporter